MDFGQLIGGVILVGECGGGGAAYCFEGAVVERVVLVVFLLRGAAVGDLREALEFVVAVGVAGGGGAYFFGLAAAVADAVIAVVVLTQDR